MQKQPLQLHCRAKERDLFDFDSCSLQVVTVLVQLRSCTLCDGHSVPSAGSCPATGAEVEWAVGPSSACQGTLCRGNSGSLERKHWMTPCNVLLSLMSPCGR